MNEFSSGPTDSEAPTKLFGDADCGNVDSGARLRRPATSGATNENEDADADKDNWREAAPAKLARGQTLFALRALERPMSAVGNREVGRGSRPVAADQQLDRRARSLQRDLFAADGFAPTVAPAAGQLSHAQPPTRGSAASQVRQLRAQNSLSADRDHLSSRQHSHYHAAIVVSAATEPSDDRRHSERGDSRTLAAGPPTSRAGSRLAREGVAAAAAEACSLVAHNCCRCRCRCPCHLSAQCTATVCSPNGADSLWVRPTLETDSGGSDSHEQSSTEGSYRICIKLPKRVDRIVLCRRPQLHFAIKMSH